MDYLITSHDPRFPLRVRLCVMVALLLLPALVVAGALSFRLAAAEREQIEQELARTAEQRATEIDREIESTKAMLVVLAGSRYLQTGDLEGFHRRASEIARQLGTLVVLHRPTQDRRVITTSVPWDETPELTMPAVRLAAEQRAIESGQAVVSDVFFGPVSKQYLVAVILPVMRNGVCDYVLSIGIPAAKLSSILASHVHGPGRVDVILDRRNAFVARSGNSDAFVGTQAPSEVAWSELPNAGMLDVTNRDGIRFHDAYRRAKSTGWLMLSSVEETVLNATIRKAWASSVGTTLALFVSAIGLTYLTGRRIERTVGKIGIDRRPTGQEFALLLDSAPNGVVLVDTNGLIVLTNRQLEQMFGYAGHEMIGRPVEILIPGDFRSGHVALRQDFVQHSTMRPMGAGRDILGRRKDGGEFPIEIGLNPIATHSGQYVMATVVDVTARVSAARALHVATTERDQLRRRLMQAAEDERLRLARELHDQTGQPLIAATLAAKDLARSLDPEGQQKLAKLNGLLDLIGRTLHQVAWELRPASIDELGLKTTLNNYVADWSAQIGVDADFLCDVDIDHMPDETRTTIYRVVQEALTNIAKHAVDAKNVSVVLKRTGSTLQLTIDDRGDGFDLAESLGKPSKLGSLGIPSMRERVALIGGTLDVESSIGFGTTVYARIPMPQVEVAT
ncbi:MAG: PAS domain S-box protein [Rhodopseudomonas sp.]|uniref:PAS domain S-box protein n=1 Tax=Rhodopseudomonas sp. TaxID=1078 RepID=UPI001824F0B4|nr:PAS domain S-box protein [Rhodopseudomonas sp.]NVN88583.1 PAS domain S-box protein [Rhodopseudomonas sp.]